MACGTSGRDSAQTSDKPVTSDDKPMAALMHSIPPCIRPSKLYGRQFYEAIGKPRVVLAPMVDQSEFAWRMLARSYLPPKERRSLLAYTPMLHARLFAATAKHRDESFQPLRRSLDCVMDEPATSSLAPSELFLDGNPAIDRPLFVQFCANDPDYLLAAARYVAPFCDAVDLNLGCPQGIARRGRYGAFLQEDWDLVHRLINRLHTDLSIPVTAKIRILETKEQTLAYAKMVISAGASILTVHGRRRDQKGQNTGLADWNVIRYLRDNLPEEVVLFANGNVLRHEDLEACRRYTGADAVMAAEAALYNPAVFSPPPVDGASREYWVGKDGKGGYRMDGVMRRYLDIIYRYVLEREPPTREPLFMPSDPGSPTLVPSGDSDSDFGDSPARKRQGRHDKVQSPDLRFMRSHTFSLLRSMVVERTDVRDAVARCVPGDMAAFERVLTLVEAVTKEGLIEHEHSSGPAMPETKAESNKEEPATALLMDTESSVAAVERCKRPYWICQSYIRPSPKEAIEKGALRETKTNLRTLSGEVASSPIQHVLPGQVLDNTIDVATAAEAQVFEPDMQKETLVYS